MNGKMGGDTAPSDRTVPPMTAAIVAGRNLLLDRAGAELYAETGLERKNMFRIITRCGEVDGRRLTDVCAESNRGTTDWFYPHEGAYGLMYGYDGEAEP